MTAPRRPPADQPVRDAAASRLNESFLLEAGAGTGKTTVLLSRVVEIVKTHIPLEKIAVITFTEKAAGELKLRLREELERMLADSAGTSWGEVLGQSLEALDRATVCTIHAFAASLLRERPVEGGVDPRFTVADELACTLLMEETWERWLEREMAAGAAPLGRALRAGVTLPHIRRLAFDLLGNRDVAQGAPPAGDARPLERARDRIVEEIARLVELSAACVEEGDAGFRQTRDLGAAVARLREAPREDLPSRLGALPLKSHLGSQKNWRPSGRLSEVKKIISDLAALRDETVRSARSIFAHEIAGWIRGGYFQAYRSAKEARRLLDFADILVICRNMLRDSRAARTSFQQRYDCLLVDEFQDTDPLQSEILFLLAADDPEVADWRLARPKPGKLFVVGDPKQSIYRFRRADIEIYEEAKDLIARAGGVTGQGLTQNFRTVPSVISWVNDLFGALIQEVPGAPYQPVYRPIVADREDPDVESARVLLLMPAKTVELDGARAGEVRQAEARHVVGLIRAAIDGEWPVLDRGARAPRAMRFRDITLLFRTGTALEIYEEALRAREVPYRITGGRRYYMRAEMRSLQAVLAAIESPFDPLAVVSALRSAFFGHSDEELLARVASRGDWVYTHDRAGAGTPFEKAFELLARLHAGRNLRPLAATLEDLYESSGALALFYLKPDGDQRAANLLKAIDLARAHEQTSGATFGSYARWLGRMAEEERDEGEAPLMEETESGTGPSGEAGDAVRILTVHKAKGLEFPMVVLCDPAGRPRAGGPGCVVERGIEGSRIEFRLGAKESGLESAGYHDAVEREKARLQAEAIRLFYVASTRARDYLVIPAFAGERPGGFYEMLQGAGFLPETGRDRSVAATAASLHRGARLLDGGSLDLEPRASHPYRLPVQEVEPADPSLRIEKEAWRRAVDLVLTAPPTGRVFRSASAMEKIPSAAPAPEGAGERAGEGVGEGAGEGARRTVARAIGRAAHAVLERIDLATGRDIGVLCEEESARAGRPDQTGEVRTLVERALQSRIVKEALAAPRSFKELPVSAAAESYITEDRIDLVFEAGGAFTIVDFKTDQVSTDEEITARVEAYKPQALIYARVLSQITAMPVARVVFLFIRPGVEKVLKVDEAFLMMGRRLLETGTTQPIP